MNDLSSLRKDFPLLKKEVRGKPLIYLDNACMSLRPQPVIDEINRYYAEMSACAGRSNHRLARAVTDVTQTARKKVAKFIGAPDPATIIFLRNTTEALNLVANSIGLKRGDTVITTDKEHNSNLVPWLKLKRTIGINHVVVSSKKDNIFDLTKFEQALEKHKPKLVSLVMSSNLDGVTTPIDAVTTRARRVKAMVMVDAAQAVPHKEINVNKLDVDFLAFSGHKMMGPTGMGILYGKRELLEQMEGFIVGGDTVTYTTYTDYKHLPIPEKFEAGLQDYSGIMGLGAACDYLEKIGMNYITQHEVQLNRIISEGLLRIPRVTLIGPKDPELRGGVVAFYIKGADPHQISLLLDESFGIMVRSGQHCVHSWFHAHKLNGSVRASVYAYNTSEEAEKLVEAVDKIIQII